MQRGQTSYTGNRGLPALTEEIARDKMLADRDEEGMAELFTKCGVYVDQDEAFYVEPKKEKED